MPPSPLFDLNKIDMNKIIVDRDGIYKVNPHRYEFMLLDAICYLDHANCDMAGFRDIKADEFWVKGHIPGRPLFPGVLMIETAAQMVSYYANTVSPGKGFLGFSAVDNVKFRGTVTCGQRLLMVGKMLEMRQRRCIGAAQGFVDGQMVFEGSITGMWL